MPPSGTVLVLRSRVEALPVPVVREPTGGGWWSLVALRQQAREAAALDRAQPYACALCGTPLVERADGVRVCPDDGWPWPAAARPQLRITPRHAEQAVACGPCGTPLVTGPDGRPACPDDGWRP